MITYYTFAGEMHPETINSMLDVTYYAGQNDYVNLQPCGIAPHLEASTALAAFANESQRQDDTLVIIRRNVITPQDIINKLNWWGSAIGVVSALSYMAHEPYAPLVWTPGWKDISIPEIKETGGTMRCVFAASDAILFRRWAVDKLLTQPGAHLVQTTPASEGDYLPAERMLGEALLSVKIPWHVDTGTKVKRIASIGITAEISRIYAEDHAEEMT